MQGLSRAENAELAEMRGLKGASGSGAKDIPRCFGVKCAEAIENKGDGENGETKCAQAYEKKGCREFFGWIRV